MIGVEAVTLDEAATRCRLSREVFEKHYDGPKVRIGRNVRVTLAHLDEWLNRRAGLTLPTSEKESWGAFDVGAR